MYCCVSFTACRALCPGWKPWLCSENVGSQRFCSGDRWRSGAAWTRLSHRAPNNAESKQTDDQQHIKRSNTRLMRHADSNVTLEHYAHIVGDAERVASEEFSQQIGRNITELKSASEPTPS
jgi:hypothetical protein